MITPTPKPAHPAPIRRILLQIAVAIGGLVPVLAGLTGIIWGPELVDGGSVSSISLDSHYRYLSGLLMGIGFGFWTTIPAIEKKTPLFQMLATIVVLGGLGRVYALITMGLPDGPMLGGLVMEIIVTPLLASWQFALARRYSAQEDGV